jgi:hypothetical protein
MDPQISAAWISAGATSVGAALGFGAIYFQIGKQAAQTRTAIAEGESRKLRTELYKEGVLAGRRVSDRGSEFMGYIHRCVLELAASADRESRGERASIPSGRFPEYLRVKAEVTDAIFDLVFLIEERRIVDPRFIVFRDAFNAVAYDLNGLGGSPLSDALMRALPTDNPEGGTYHFVAPNTEQLQQVRELFQSAMELSGQLTAYVEDLIVEMQNQMLGDMFGSRLDHRAPPDPKQLVIRLEDYQQVTARLRKTRWGQMIAAQEAEMIKKFGGRDHGTTR